MSTNPEKERFEHAVRERIRDAAISLAARDRVIPTLDSLVSETGLTADEIKAHFPSMDDVAIEIRKIARELFKELEDALPKPGSLVDMLHELVDLRAQYHEAAADFKQMGDAAGQFLPSVSAQRAVRSAEYRAQLTELLDPHCYGSTASVVAKVELITSWESWRHLRGIQRLTIEQSADLVKSILTAVASEVTDRSWGE